MEDHIIYVQISVDDILFIYGIQPLNNLSNNQLRFGFRQWTLAQIQQLIQRPSIGEVLNQDSVFFVPKQLYQRDTSSWVNYSENFNFSLKVLSSLDLIFAIQIGRLNDFCCINRLYLICIDISEQHVMHRSHASTTNLIYYLVLIIGVLNALYVHA